MKPLGEELRQIIHSSLLSLSPTGLENVSIVDLPKSNQRIVQLRTIEDLLDDLEQSENDSDESATLVVSVRRPVRRTTSSATLKTSGSGEAMYLADGNLNLNVLERNASLLKQAGDTVLARNIYQAILKSGQKAPVAHLGLAQCFLHEKKYEQAQKHFEEAIAYDPKLEAYQGLITALEKQGKFQYAAETAERASAKEPMENVELLSRAGDAWKNAGDLTKSEAAYRKAIGLPEQEGSTQIYIKLAKLLGELGRHPEARPFLDRALAIQPGNSDALFELGLHTLARGEKHLALAHFARSLECQIQNLQAVYHLIKLSYELQVYEPAQTLLARYIASSPFNASLVFTLGGLRFQLGQFDAAESALRQVLQIQPHHARANDLLGRIQRQRELGTHGSGTQVDAARSGNDFMRAV